MLDSYAVSAHVNALQMKSRYLKNVCTSMYSVISYFRHLKIFQIAWEFIVDIRQQSKV